MGDKILGIVVLAIGGAILADLLVHVNGTNALFNGIGGLLSSTYNAASGAYAKAA